VKISKIGEVLDNFKRFCRKRGWKTSESEDCVELNNGYHNFLWIKHVTNSCFKAIISNRKCAIRKGLLYNVVEPSHLAWLFSEVPSDDLIRTVLQNPDFSRRIAIFDFSPMLEGKNLCVKLNNTDSPVFQEFETYLQNELKVKVKPFASLHVSKTRMSTNVLPELA